VFLAPALGAQRRLEARIRQWLGDCPVNHHAVTHEEQQSLDRRADRHDHRVLARALTDCPLTDA
jgi:hypothetical protein